MDPITFLTALGLGGVLLVVYAAFLIRRSVCSVRDTGRYTAPPEY